MLKDLLNRLLQPSPPPLPEPDARTALSALLVRIARSDGDYAQEEITRIDKILARHFALSEEEARALRMEAEALEQAAPDTVRFTRAIKAAVPHEARLSILEAAWEVVLADGRRDRAEDALMRLVSDLLGITDRDSGLARQRVAARMS